VRARTTRRSRPPHRSSRLPGERELVALERDGDLDVQLDLEVVAIGLEQGVEDHSPSTVPGFWSSLRIANIDVPLTRAWEPAICIAAVWTSRCLSRFDISATIASGCHGASAPSLNGCSPRNTGSDQAGALQPLTFLIRVWEFLDDDRELRPPRVVLAGLSSHEFVREVVEGAADVVCPLADEHPDRRMRRSGRPTYMPSAVRVRASTSSTFSAVPHRRP
jgi:hypothetical protein